jgi:hypothetical protein
VINANHYKLYLLRKIMDETQNLQEPGKSFLSDFNNRLMDIDERNKIVRERVLLLGKSLLSSKEDLEKDLEEIRIENREIKKELEKIKKVTNSLLNEFGKFVKKEEIYLVERMLKDFQPLEFMRKKDVEELIEKKMGEPKKQIKTKDSRK